MLPYVFPDLAAFATVADLITHLRISDAHYRSALPTEFCAKDPPPMYITLYYLVTRLPDSLASVMRLGVQSLRVLSLGVLSLGVRSLGGAEPEGVEPGGAEFEGAESRGAEPWGTASSGGPADALPRLFPRPEPLSTQQQREWFAQRTRLRSGAAGARVSPSGDTGPGGVADTARAGGAGGAGAPGSGGARTRNAGATGTGCVGGARAGGAGAGDPAEPGCAGARGTGAGDTGAVGARAGGTGAGGAGAGGAGAGDTGLDLGLPSSSGLTPPLQCPPPHLSQPPLLPASPLPAPSPYTEQTGGPTERRELESRPALLVCVVCTGRRVPHLRPPPVPRTYAMALRPSCVPLRVPLPPPPESSLLAVPDPESDRARTSSPTVSRCLATVVNDPSFESTAASALVAELVHFAATDVLEDRQEDFECLAAAVPRLASMLLALEGDPDAPDIPTPRSYGEAITGPYSSQWQAAMDAEMASWKSTRTYVDKVPPLGANIVDGMWISKVKRSPVSPPAFKARYVA
ncbi:unnamed protein product [Closterium sp. NIES-54]